MFRKQDHVESGSGRKKTRKESVDLGVTVLMGHLPPVFPGEGITVHTCDTRMFMSLLGTQPCHQVIACDVIVTVGTMRAG